MPEIRQLTKSEYREHLEELGMEEEDIQLALQSYDFHNRNNKLFKKNKKKESRKQKSIADLIK